MKKLLLQLIDEEERQKNLDQTIQDTINDPAYVNSWLIPSSECENFNEPDITTDWRTKQSIESGINPFGEL